MAWLVAVRILSYQSGDVGVGVLAKVTVGGEQRVQSADESLASTTYQRGRQRINHRAGFPNFFHFNTISSFVTSRSQ